ncbi:MAG: S49 family peptidase [Gemmobacter sp.]
MNTNLPFLNRPPRVALIRLTGAIGAASRFGGGLNDAALAPVVERAFSAGRPKALALVINSPGGSAVQSSLIAARIRRLAEEKKIPVHAFVEDVAASGGYWLACAADDIWIDPASMVGSIGVIAASFGLHELLARQGVERRVHTAGRSKSFLDPFLPEKPEDVERLRGILDPIHRVFIDHVRARRGNRLNEGAGPLFEGDVWVGQAAVDAGLADGIAHAGPKLRELYGKDVRVMVHGQRRPFLRRFGLAALGESAVETALAEAEDRALRSRFGL